MITVNNIPSEAKPHFYAASNGHKATYWTWQYRRNCWFWSSLGNSGEQVTEELAATAARLWISDGKELSIT